MFAIKRIYERSSPRDGYRVLVDRLWPRGVSKEEARLGIWLKDIAPSDALRNWFGHDPKKWPAFQKKYAAELKSKPGFVEFLRAKERAGKNVTLLFAAEDEVRNNAAVLKKYLASGPKMKFPAGMPKAGSVAPDIELPDQGGEWHRLSYHRGGWVLLYFYPKDDTPGCTKEACGLRDYFPNFRKLKAKVFGVSVDSIQSHAKFAKKYKLPFTLLSDEGRVAVRTYGVWGKKKFMGRVYEGTLRTSFLIDPKWKVRKVYKDVNPAIHSEEVLADLNELK